MSKFKFQTKPKCQMFGFWNCDIHLAFGFWHLKFMGLRDIRVNSIPAGILGDIHRIVGGFNKPLQAKTFLELH